MHLYGGTFIIICDLIIRKRYIVFWNIFKHDDKVCFNKAFQPQIAE